MDEPQPSSDTKKREGSQDTVQKSKNKKLVSFVGNKLPGNFFACNCEVLKVLVQSGFLGSDDLKKLILSETNEDLKWHFTASFGKGGSKTAENEFWKAVVFASCQNKSDVIKCLTTTGLSAVDYASEILGIRKKEEKLPRPLQSSSQDYVLVVTIKGLGDKIVNTTIPGNEIEEFFKSGEATVMFDEPIYEGQHSIDHHKYSFAPGGDIHLKFSANVYIVRRAGISDNRRVLWLGESNSVATVVADDAGVEDSLYVIPIVEDSSDFFSNLYLFNTTYGRKLIKKFADGMDTISIDARPKCKMVVSSARNPNAITMQVVGLVLDTSFYSREDALFAGFRDDVSLEQVTFASFIEAMFDE